MSQTTEIVESQAAGFGANVFKLATVDSNDKVKNQSDNNDNRNGRDNSHDRKPHLHGQQDQKPMWNDGYGRNYWNRDGRFGQGHDRYQGWHRFTAVEMKEGSALLPCYQGQVGQAEEMTSIHMGGTTVCCGKSG